MNNSDAYQQHMTSEFDSQFESANQVTAFPWVGKNYRHSEILILGHTAHSPGLQRGSSKPLGRDDNREIVIWPWTKDGIPFPQNRGRNGRPLKNTCNMFLGSIGKPYNRENQIAFWESVAFTNYCQCAVSRFNKFARCPCDKESKQATTQAIAILKPKLIIAWTTQLWKFHFPVDRVYKRIGWSKPRIAFATEQMPAVIGMQHPSRGSSTARYKFLESNEVSKASTAKLVQYLSTVLKK